MILAGCTAIGKMADVMMDPDIQVGSNDDQPSTLGFSLLAERDINPNESGEAAPIEFQVVLLAEDSKLLATDYDQVTGRRGEGSGQELSGSSGVHPAAQASTSICRPSSWMRKPDT